MTQKSPNINKVVVSGYCGYYRNKKGKIVYEPLEDNSYLTEFSELTKEQYNYLLSMEREKK